MVESYLKNRLKEKEIMLMTHIVIGYPTYVDSFKIIESMVNAGVDLMELQIPFSEPIADGPVILHANQKSLSRGTKVQKCMDFAQNITGAFDIPFLFMSYYNILFKYGVDRFAGAMSENGLQGAIVPDLPPEEGEEYLELVKSRNLVPIQIFAPTSTKERMQHLAQNGAGFIYCVARRGVTGQKTDFDQDFNPYIARCRSATDLPLAVGFGIRSKEDVDYLVGKADIAVIGTETIRLVDQQGAEAVGPFIAGLR